ncbi:Crp/Fnr family transcriptional regulator [Propionivibrio dicarboxylicus]|uniref:Cyclic nucleotide-binding domain-containing protein n=1 Tax=Propionivibrio dicarboxylicus TaxID=83767 RepID=A0A1G8NC76_9RHOO|nr:cyclic nucleotide-binding domain-containing protein [Propionivibrio dicarboxylicus]SDI77696.1 Cyclic nucleotide-binding domain-containing protein [Propionivibrio dicarboxylicus]
MINAEFQSLLVKLIEHVPVFAGLTPQELHELLSGAERRRVAAGQAIMRQGDSGRFMCILIDGQASVSKQGNGHFTRHEVGMLSRGDCFGEMALVDPAARSATIEAATDCLLIRIQESDCWRNPAIASKVYRNIAVILAQRLRDTQELLIQRGLPAQSESAGLAS